MAHGLPERVAGGTCLDAIYLDVGGGQYLC